MSHGRIRVQRRRHSRFTYKIRYRCSEYALLIRPTGMWDSKPMKAIMQGIPIDINDEHGRTPPWAGPEQLGGGFASGMAVSACSTCVDTSVIVGHEAAPASGDVRSTGERSEATCAKPVGVAPGHVDDHVIFGRQPHAAAHCRGMMSPPPYAFVQ